MSRSRCRAEADPFDAVRELGLAMPDVEAATKYDGSPLLKRGGSFMAGLAMHSSAEPDTLVVRARLDEREAMLEDAPETYYLTDYYRRHPVVLVRLARIDRDALRDLLTVSWRLTAMILLVLLGSSACGGHNPGGPTSAAPQISCPSDVSIRGVPTLTGTVTFSSPIVTGGTSPIQTSCNPASGSAFALGVTEVSCSASDAASRVATCSFHVALTGFSIAQRKYEAFGDSLTAGETGRPSIAGFNEIDLPNAYPTQLQQDFDANYPGQGVVVINRGHSLDTAGETDSLVRSFAAVDRPDVVLLLTGYNNLAQPCGAAGSGTQACRDAVRNLGADVRSCIRHAREVDDQLKFVFVSTLTPPGASGSNRIDRNAIIQANDQIRQAVSLEHAVLVDSYAAFVGHEAEYVNVDGLHLKPAGYQALADGFFAAIRSTVQQTPLVR